MANVQSPDLGESPSGFLSSGGQLGAALKSRDSKVVALGHLWLGFLVLIIAGLAYLSTLFAAWSPHGMGAKYFDGLFSANQVLVLGVFCVTALPGFVGGFVAPLMLGAPLAFPKLQRFGLHLAAVSVATLALGAMLGGFGGTFDGALPPVTHPTLGRIFLLAGLAAASTGSAVSAINLIATLHAYRAPGLRFRTLPVTLSAAYISGLVHLFTAPVWLFGVLALGAARFLNVSVFEPSLGGESSILTQLLWFALNGGLYAGFILAAGVVVEALAPLARKAVFGQAALIVALAALALLGLLSSGQHQFGGLASPRSTLLTSAFALLALLALWVVLCCLALTLVGGATVLRSPALFGVGFIFNGALTFALGLLAATPGTGSLLASSAFGAAFQAYLGFGSVLFGLLTALHFWWPKIFGREVPESSARVSFFLIFAGFHLTFLPQALLGLEGLPPRPYTLAESPFASHVSAFAAMLLAAGLLTALMTLLKAAKDGPIAKQNPWGARTLEWSLPNPVRAVAFAEPPIVARGPYDFPSQDTWSGEESRATQATPSKE